MKVSGSKAGLVGLISLITIAFTPSASAVAQSLSQRGLTEQETGAPHRLSPQIPEPALPDQPLPPLPTPQLLTPAPADLPAADIPTRVFVNRFVVVGSTVFSQAELNQATAPYTGREITFAELLQARSAVTQLYLEKGYITSGSFIPPQTVQAGAITIQVIEGSVSAIHVTGTRRLNPSYIRSRLARVTGTPLNQNRLLQGLQLLQLDPLIATVSADLQAGIQPGTNVLQVEVQEADPFDVQATLDNNRSPSVGSFRRQIQFNQGNLTGLGDALSVDYTNTDGSNEVNASYTLPVNSRNGSVRIATGLARSNVIEQPFDQINLASLSQYFELSYRHPIVQTPTTEFALGLTASRQESQTQINGAGFPLSLDADEQGRTRVSALRWFQEWTERSRQHVFAVRSQFSLGVDWFDATVNSSAPDSRFFSWRGQGQWVQLLAADTLLLMRTDIQLADSPLVALEQFNLGGVQSVRGYRQDALLSNNGAFFSAEARIPIVRVPQKQGILQVIPFLDLGTAWYNPEVESASRTLAGTGIGLLWQQPDFSARLDWGFPLIGIDSEKATWQENGIYFSIVYRFF